MPPAKGYLGSPYLQKYTLSQPSSTVHVLGESPATRFPGHVYANRNLGRHSQGSTSQNLHKMGLPKPWECLPGAAGEQTNVLHKKTQILPPIVMATMLGICSMTRSLDVCLLELSAATIFFFFYGSTNVTHFCGLRLSDRGVPLLLSWS